MSANMKRQSLIAVAHDVRSMHNVGAIYRTADAAGFSSVICSGFTGAPPDPRIAKVALGADSALDTEQVESVDALLGRLRSAVVIVLEQHPSSMLPEDLPSVLSSIGSEREIALVACGELTGAPGDLITRADAILELPMRGSKESLNVSVAFGIASFAVAAAVSPVSSNDLRSRHPARPLREGVLTRGVTRGEKPEHRS